MISNQPARRDRASALTGGEGDGDVRRRGSVISQLLVAFAVFAVLMAIAALVGYVTVVRGNETASQLTSRSQTLLHASNQVDAGFRDSHEWALSIAVSGDRSYLPRLSSAWSEFIYGLGTLEHQSPASLRGMVAGVARASTNWLAIVSQVMAAKQATPRSRALVKKSLRISTALFTTIKVLQQRLDDQITAAGAQNKQTLQTGLTWSAGALGVAVLLVLAGSLSTLRTVTRPLRDLATTVSRLGSGDYSARATTSGSAEVREVAQAVNARADEADQFRAQEAESNRLRAMVRAAGIRIREPLTASGVIQEARTILEQNVDADLAYLHLIVDGRLTSPVGHEDDWLLADTFSAALPDEHSELLQGLSVDQPAAVVEDLQADDDERLPPWLRAPLREAGFGSVVAVPFGVGGEALGLIAMIRFEGASRWSRAEIDAVESIATDLGRGLNHARLYEKENRLVEDLKALDRAKSDFFATVSHELRAPLTSIEGYLELLSEGEAGPITPEQRHMLTTVDRGAARLRNLIDDVFTLAQLESRAFSSATKPVNIAEVIAGAVEAVRPEVSAAKLTLASTSQDGLIVEGDAGELDRVLINLLSNSVKYTPEGGHIEVSAEAENGSAIVQVSDTGIGIPEADQGELFERFFRASNARQRSIPGTGLGLAIVRTIVTNHGGEVRLQSREEKGTTFTVRLPLLVP
jgi:two-component system phosphate regulon sensor histidine kinase PhoR